MAYMTTSERTKKEKTLAEEIKIDPRHVCMVGSTLICGEGNDEDYLCLIPDTDDLLLTDFEPDLENPYADSPLQSFRDGSGRNVIAVTDRGFFLAEVAIAHAAHVTNNFKFDLSTRDGRVRFHTYVRAEVLARSETEDFL